MPPLSLLCECLRRRRWEQQLLPTRCFSALGGGGSAGARLQSGGAALPPRPPSARRVCTRCATAAQARAARGLAHAPPWLARGDLRAGRQRLAAGQRWLRRGEETRQAHGLASATAYFPSSPYRTRASCLFTTLWPAAAAQRWWRRCCLRALPQSGCAPTLDDCRCIWAACLSIRAVAQSRCSSGTIPRVHGRRA